MGSSASSPTRGLLGVAERLPFRRKRSTSAASASGTTRSSHFTPLPSFPQPSCRLFSTRVLGDRKERRIHARRLQVVFALFHHRRVPGRDVVFLPEIVFQIVELDRRLRRKLHGLAIADPRREQDTGDQRRGVHRHERRARARSRSTVRSTFARVEPLNTFLIADGAIEK